MSASNLAPIRALHALAHWQLGEAALDLARELDQHARDQAACRALDERSQGALAAYEESIRPDMPMNLAAVGWLSRQAQGIIGQLSQAQNILDLANRGVDASRDTLAKRQTYCDALDDALQQEKRRQIQARHAKEQSSLDDLMAARHLNPDRTRA